MTELRTMLGTTLFQQLDKLRESKGEITVDDAGAIVAQLMRSGGGGALQQEIVGMIRDIETAKGEILALSNNRQANRQAISDASAHLDTVIKSTEEATNSFIDAANRVQELAEGIGGEKEEELKAVCTRIYESCNFQDLASQRITKVIKLIQTLETHFTKLLELFAIPAGAAQDNGNGGITLPANDRDLLNGPQLPRDAISQDDVDALFKSLKAGG